MRPGQSNKRMRGRPNGRKGPNPLTRSYESSGPDVKIRGTAQHIGEKYLQLARDAQASGDPIMAESYLQHAEHYFRIIAAAQQAQQQGLGGYQAQFGDPSYDEVEETADFGGIPDRFASPIDRAAQPQPGYLTQAQPSPPQPLPERSAQGNGERQGPMRPERSARPPQDRGYKERDHQSPLEKPYPEMRMFQERNGHSRDQEARQPRAGRDYRNESGIRPGQRTEMQLADEGVSDSGLPAFITAPARIPSEAREPALASETHSSLHTSSPDADGGANGFHPRPRRRRSAKVDPEVAALRSEEGSATDSIQE
ncbi:MAG TPA: DUF4167 domain-containing protein [Methylocella sp.]|nr:DUF4167 domain-containing protein [Methylocella sp.]